MPARKRTGRASAPMVYPDAVMMRLEGAARVGWAKFYAEARRADDFEHANTVLVDRIETLVPELLDLVNDVLYERNPQAFCRAYRILRLVEDFQTGARR